MGKKPAAPAPGLAPPPEWDPCMKELWHLDFEKESVNDDKWSCVVTAAIPAEAEDDECIQSYIQCVNTGLRKVVKIISMTDVVELLKGSLSVTNNQKAKPDKTKPEKFEKSENLERGDFKFVNSRPNDIVNLAAKYATCTDVECKLPPDLMAAVLKYLILNLKDENCFCKRVETVKARKIREKILKAKFIRSLKPYEVCQDERQSFAKVPPNFLELEEPINDQPFNGPDLYIMLTDIYDLFCFPELVRLKVPFLALLRVSNATDKGQGKSSLTFVPSRTDANGRKAVLLTEFWEGLKENCTILEETKKFKDMAMVDYKAPSLRNIGSKNYYLQKLFDELTWIQYSVYGIQRQHQMYLRELYVQRLIISLEPLDLNKCEVYSRICDILITGQPLTPALVLFAMIEQVVEGVPETKSMAFEYKPEFDSFASNKSQSLSVKRENLKHLKEKRIELTTPCSECRDKIAENYCEKHRNAFILPVKNNRISEETSELQSQNQQSLLETSDKSLKSKSLLSKESGICEMLGTILAERKAERDTRKNKKWKAPDLCFYGDNVFLQMYHCDPRILTPENLINRFLISSEVSKIWGKYPELSPKDRAFFNFHFSSFLKISNESEESLKLKIYFAIVMKLLGTIKSYLYRGLEKSLSETIFYAEKERMKKMSKVKFEQNLGNAKGEDKNFFRTLVADKNLRMAIKHYNKSDIYRSKSTLNTKIESESLRKVLGIFSMTFLSHHSSGMCLQIKQSDILSPSSSLLDASYQAKDLSTLLDLPEISNLNEPHFLNNKNEYLQLTQSFKYYEALHPHVMIQRLLEAEQNYNTAQYSYFTPTDTVIVAMMNDFDHRGVFYSCGIGVLPTPVALRDFHNYVHTDILDWSLEVEERYKNFISFLKEELQAQEEKQDKEYITQLKREYCEMSPEKKNEFLETVVDLYSEPEVTEKELGDLPLKPSFPPANKVSFVTTNLADVRVECRRKVNEFYSRDGTEVNVMTDNWLYQPLSLLTLLIKRSKLQLYYHQWLGDENINTAFTFKTTSDIIFAFYKNDTEEAENFNYNVNMSWPTGLMVQPVFSDSGLYIKQGYLTICRNGWDIEEEKSRCYLKNGQILVFKENGDLDILCGNGTRYVFYESTSMPRYEIISTTGEVWEIRTKGPCRYRKKLKTTQKIYIGTDPKTQETYYRREDGVNCMLWPNGRLVTTYSDGTKITSTPYFDKEVEVEWSEEEKLYFLKVESKQKMEVSELRSRTILRNSSCPRMSENSIFTVEAFVSISCSYLMEHPKYSSVFFNPEEPFITLIMPQKLRVLLSPEGNYEVQQERQNLTVQDGTVEFSFTCDDCGRRSKATINFDDEILCKVVDFFQKGFFVNRDGKAMYQDNIQECGESDECDVPRTYSETMREQCINQHTKPNACSQRCFALNRDMSGVEFVQADTLAYDCFKLPDDTYFDLHTDDPPKISHTFSAPYYKVDYENWEMEYQDSDNSLPTNLKKNDLKELGVKDNCGKSFKYPFPKHYNCSELQLTPRPQKQVNMPKVMVTRIVKCLSPEPTLVIQNINAYIGIYQKRARDICTVFASQKVREELSKDQRSVKMRLKKIALTLNQSLKMYPHMCTQSPSTEKDIHYFGHFIQLMDEFRHQSKNDQDAGLDCKQISRPFPRSSAFHAIDEETEPT